MKQDRFLMIILSAVGLLVVVALVLFFTRQGPQDYGSDGTPEGVVRNYLLAIQKRDYQRAYLYLHEDESKPDFTLFQQSYLQSEGDITQTAVQLGDVEILGNQALVDMTIIHTSNDPFNRTWDQTATALLAFQNGDWRIVNMPYPYWGWDWYIKERQ